MMLDDFDLIGSSKTTGTLTFLHVKNNYRIHFRPNRVDSEGNITVEVIGYQNDDYKKFDRLEKAIAYVRDIKTDV